MKKKIIITSSSLEVMSIKNKDINKNHNFWKLYIIAVKNEINVMKEITQQRMFYLCYYTEIKFLVSFGIFFRSKNVIK